MKNYNKNLIKIIFLAGILWRFLIILFQTHIYDSLNIIALFKSIADTNSLIPGFFTLKNKGVGEIQLYGKLFYQIGAIWLLLIEKLKILEIKYLFDTKPYQSLYSYLDGFLQWGVFHYQLVAIKFFQFIFDFLILLFLIKIFNLFNHPKKFLITIFLFWAFYPLLPYTGYVLLQSDILLVVTILGSLYFILKYVIKKRLLNLFISLLFISLGAVIKQVSILFFPLILIVFGENFYLFLGIILVFLISYFIFSQSWTPDFFLIKKFLINSKESLALFNFNLNGLPVFFIGYLFLIFFIFKNRERLKNNIKGILTCYILILSLVYLTYDINNLFVQFNLWISPLLLLASLLYKNVSPFLILPMIGFLKRAFEDNDVILGSFGPALGSSLHHTIKYQYFLQQFLHPDIFMFFIRALFIYGYCFLFYFLFQIFKNFKEKKIKIFKKNNLFIKLIFNPNLLILTIFLVYNFLVFFDLYLRKSTSLLTKYNYEETERRLLEKTPLLVKVDNKNSLSIKGIDIKLSVKNINYDDPLIIEIFDKKFNILDKIYFSLHQVNNIHDELTFIKFNKSIKEKEFFIKMSNKNLKNEILFSLTKIKSLGDTGGHYAGYDMFFTREEVKLYFPKEIFYINLRGDYSFNQMINQFKFHYFQKPKFYTAYFSLILILLLNIIFLFSKLQRFYFQKFFEKMKILKV